MPTQREYERLNPELKTDTPPRHRLRFLDTMSSVWEYPVAWLTPTGCRVCTAGRYVVTALALYGLYSVISLLF